MSRRLAILIVLALPACGDATGIDGLVPIPVLELKDFCGSQKLIGGLELYGPAGSTTTDPKPGRWVIRGNYDFRNATIGTNGPKADSAMLVMDFNQANPDETNDNSVPHEVFIITADKLTGSFAVSGGFAKVSQGPGLPYVRAQVKGDLWISCVLLR